MKKILLLTLTATLLMSSTAPRPVDLHRVMGRFDQAFIPFWFVTEAGDMTGAREHLIYLAFRRQHLERTLHMVFPEGPWTEHLDRASGWLDDAFLSVETGNLHLASISLDHALFEMMALRRSLSISDYYLDGLYQLHSSLDILTEVTEDQKMCLLEWAEVEQMIAQLRQDWQTIASRQPEADTYDLSTARVEALQECYQRISQNMALLEVRLKQAQRTELAKAVTDTHASVLQAIRLFGHFEDASVFYAEPQGVKQYDSKFFSHESN